MYRKAWQVFLATTFMTSPALSNSCGLGMSQNDRAPVLDCAIASAFEASFGLHELSLQSIKLIFRSANLNAGALTNRYSYHVFFSNNEAANQVRKKDQSLVGFRDNFEIALAKDVCEVNGVQNATRSGTSFAIDFKFFLPGQNESSTILGDQIASIYLDTCEAP